MGDSFENGESSNASCDFSSFGNLITEEMVDEEAKLEEKAIQEERHLKEKLSLEEKQKLEEQCYKRLNLLLSRSSIYAQFMADKLKRDNIKVAKKESRIKKQSAKSNIQSNDQENHSAKRKREMNSSPRKKHQPTLTVIDVFKKENENFEQININNDTVDSCLSSKNVISCTAKQPALLTGGVMHPYQIEGFEWLKVLFENGVNGILADEMGLGKTIQSIAFIAYLVEMGVSGPFLVCGPLTTVPNWYSEFKRFAPSIPVIVYHGRPTERKELTKKINKKVRTENAYCCPVVITSYHIPIIDRKALGKIDWKLLVVDEAHRIKNFRCQLITVLKSFTTSHRLLLTGTPLQNDLSELWSLLNFILPEIFDDLKVFEAWFDISRISEKQGDQEIVSKEQEKRIVSIIHQILTPFLLRRTKAEVDLKLPDKKEIIVHAPFTKIQQEYYAGVLNKTIADVLERDTGNLFDVGEVDINSSRPKRANSSASFTALYKELNDYNFDTVSTSSVNAASSVQNSVVNISKSSEIRLNTRNTVAILRQICLHPYLISYPLDDDGNYKIDEDLVKSSGKFLVLDIMLPELKKRGHKVLIFSQFVRLIEILEDYCNYRNHYYNKICGHMDLTERKEQIQDFNENEDAFLFLISTRAGGLGINLAAADTVIIFDSDWNPQSDLQAQDRCHRIGQNKPVVIYRFLVPNTIDERIHTRATAKRKLEKVIIKKGRFNTQNTEKQSDKLTIEEMLELLQSCEINSFIKTNANSVLSAEELEKILDRSDMSAEI